MAFAVKGSVGSVRHRIHPRKAETRGSRGVVGKHAKHRYNKTVLDATRKFEFERTRDSKGVLTKALGKVKGFFARGNR
jgi:hypothetical protein